MGWWNKQEGTLGSAHQVNPRNQEQRDEDYTWHNTAPNESVDHTFGFQI
jgi:hypothetical protein